MRRRVRLTESDLHRIIKESVNRILNEYAGYDSEKAAYGEQQLGNEYMKHLNRVGKTDGHSRTEDERKKSQDRAEKNKKNLDKLRLRKTNNPYREYLSNKEMADKMKEKPMDKLKKAVKESIKRVLNESYNENIFIEDEYADTLYRVDVHYPDSGDDVANAYFDDEDDAYQWAIGQVKDQELEAEIYYCDNYYDEEYYDDIREYLECDANFAWYDTIGYVDGIMNQF